MPNNKGFSMTVRRLGLADNSVLGSPKRADAESEIKGDLLVKTFGA